jgi:hypothetical protein
MRDNEHSHRLSGTLPLCQRHMSQYLRLAFYMNKGKLTIILAVLMRVGMVKIVNIDGLRQHHFHEAD